MPVSINIGSRDIRLMSISGSNIEKWEKVPLDPGLVKDGRITDPKKVAGVLDGLFKSSGLPRNSVTAAVQGMSFTYRVIKLPKLKAREMPEAVKRAAFKEFAVPADGLYLDWKIVEENDREISAFVVGAPPAVVDSVMQTMTLAGVKLAALDLTSLALARVAGEGNVLLVNFEPDSFDIVVVAEGMPVILQTIVPRGGNATLEDNAKRVAEEIIRTVDFNNITNKARPIGPKTRIILSGELAKAGAGLIGQGTGCNIELFTGQAGFPADFPAALFAVNLGLALKKPPGKNRVVGAKGFRDISIDLRNGRRGTSTKVSLRRIMPVGALAVAVVILVPLTILRGQAINNALNLQSDLESANRNLRTIRLAADAAGQDQALIARLQAETAALRRQINVIRGKGNLADSVHTVIGALPGGAEYSALMIDSSQITVEGKALSRSDVITYASDLEKTGKFTEVRIASIDEAISEAISTPGTVFRMVIDR